MDNNLFKQNEFGQVELNRLFAGIQSGEIEEDNLTMHLILHKLDSIVIKSQIICFRSQLISFQSLKEPEILTVLTKLRFHLEMLNKLGSLSETSEKTRNTAISLIKSAKLQLEVNQVLHKCGFKRLNTGIGLLEE